MLARHLSLGALSTGLLTLGFMFGFLLGTELPGPPVTDRDPNWNLYQLVGHLRAHGLCLYPVAAPWDPTLEGTVYLADHAGETWESCRNLRCQLARAGEWQGMVCVLSKTFQRAGVEENFALQDWGENGRRIAGFVFFGDQQLLNRIEGAF